MVKCRNNLQQCGHLRLLGALEQARVFFWERAGRISGGVFFEPARTAVNTRNEKSAHKTTVSNESGNLAFKFEAGNGGKISVGA